VDLAAHRYAPVDLISCPRMTATDHFMWIMLLGGGAYMMASRARGSAVLTASGEVGSDTPHQDVVLR